jgi:hypothetical protein
MFLASQCLECCVLKYVALVMEVFQNLADFRSESCFDVGRWQRPKKSKTTFSELRRL